MVERDARRAGHAGTAEKAEVVGKEVVKVGAFRVDVFITEVDEDVETAGVGAWGFARASSRRANCSSVCKAKFAVRSDS